MGRHCCALGASAHQEDRGPEVAHFREVYVPVVDHPVEDRAERRIDADLAVEAVHQRMDHLFGHAHGRSWSDPLYGRAMWLVSAHGNPPNQQATYKGYL